MKLLTSSASWYAGRTRRDRLLQHASESCTRAACSEQHSHAPVNMPRTLGRRARMHSCPVPFRTRTTTTWAHCWAGWHAGSSLCWWSPAEMHSRPWTACCCRRLADSPASHGWSCPTSGRLWRCATESCSDETVTRVQAVYCWQTPIDMALTHPALHLCLHTMGAQSSRFLALPEQIERLTQPMQLRICGNSTSAVS